MKSLQEINNEFLNENMAARERFTTEYPYRLSASTAYRPTPAGDYYSVKPAVKTAEKKKRDVFSFISDLLFYVAVFMIVMTVLSAGTENGAPKTILGYSYFTVVSRSMQDEIPMGSFILVKHTKDLKVGDTVTYMRDENTSVTHKIINVYDNYMNQGSKGFQTKGTKNIHPDENIVSESNVVGKVIFVLPGAGNIINYLKQNIYLIFILFGLFMIFSFSIQGLFVNTPKVRPAKKRGINVKEALP